MILLINNNKNANKSSYIHKLRKALIELKIPYHEVSNINEFDTIKSKIKGIIISGSRIKLSEKTLFNEFAHNIYYILNLPNVPILGICFGLQLLHLIHGGKLKDKKKYLCEVKDIKISNNNHELFKDISNLKMQFCFSDLTLPFNNHNNNKIKEIAWFKLNNKEIPCAFEYNDKVFGLLFHPEVLKTSYGIIANFAKLSGINIK